MKSKPPGILFLDERFTGRRPCLRAKMAKMWNLPGTAMVARPFAATLVTGLAIIFHITPPLEHACAYLLLPALAFSTRRGGSGRFLAVLFDNRVSVSIVMIMDRKGRAWIVDLVYSQSALRRSVSKALFGGVLRTQRYQSVFMWFQ